MAVPPAGLRQCFVNMMEGAEERQNKSEQKEAAAAFCSSAKVDWADDKEAQQ